MSSPRCKHPSSDQQILEPARKSGSSLERLNGLPIELQNQNLKHADLPNLTHHYLANGSTPNLPLVDLDMVPFGDPGLLK